jgi:hypothetical protein
MTTFRTTEEWPSEPESAGPLRGTFEVGYRICCGIATGTSNGVVLNGSVGISASPGCGFSSIGAAHSQRSHRVVSMPISAPRGDRRL